MELENAEFLPLPERCPRCKKETSTDPFCDRCNLDLRYGFLHQVKSGVCIYCPGKKHIPLSSEHVFGKWLAHKFDKDPNVEMRHSFVRPEALVPVTEFVTHKRTDEYKGHPFYREVSNVCEECNNDWMSRLHLAAQSLVIRLASGEWPELSPAEQNILARWVTMVAINQECFSRMSPKPNQTIITTQSQRDALKRGEMPKGWRISMCRMQGTKFSGFNYLRKSGRHANSSQVLPMVSTFFCIECVMFHVLTFKNDLSASLVLCESIKPMPYSFRKVWPTLEPRKIGRHAYFDVSDIMFFQSAITPHGTPEDTRVVYIPEGFNPDE